MVHPQRQPRRFYTEQEYFTLEEAADYKSEYYRGEIFGMAGASENHNLICANFLTDLNIAFRGKTCRAYTSDMKVQVPAHKFYTYPDIIALCATPEFVEGRSDTITNPMLLVEVLSASTKTYDRTTKFEFYQALPSLKYYVLVDQKRLHVEVYSKQGDAKWLLETLTQLEDVVRLEALNFETTLANIYDKVDFKKRKVRHPIMQN
jgi:Uma2 family endonuclease